MVYGLNRVCGNTLNNMGQSYVFKCEDRESLMETVTYSIENNDESLFEYCMEFADPKVLEESAVDIKKTIVRAIKAIWQKIKDAFTGIIKAIKKFLSRIGFITDKNGKLSNATNKEYSSLIDLAGEELSKEIDVPKYDIQDNYSSMIVGAFGNIVDLARHLTFEDIPKTEDEIAKRENDIKGIKERLNKAMSDLTNITNRDMLKTVKKNKLSKVEIGFIVENSAYTSAQLEKILKDQYNCVEKDLNDYIKDLSKNSITISNRATNQNIEITADEDSYNKFEQFANKTLLSVSNLLEQGYTKFSAAIETYIVQCCTAKKQLEGELLKKQKE